MTIRGLIEAQPIRTSLSSGAGGTIVDDNGRVICTMNLRHNGLSLSEAWTYAQLFIAAARDPEAILRALEADQRKNEG